jgi:hypothetical protein
VLDPLAGVDGLLVLVESELLAELDESEDLEPSLEALVDLSPEDDSPAAAFL